MHNLFGSRFVSHREPAWHGLGLVLPEPIGAAEAFQRMGPYEVELVGLRGNTPVGSLPYKLIVRDPTPDDPQHRHFGIVSRDYVLVRPKEFCQIWDEHVAQPVETIGSLGHGETLFVSMRLPTFDIQGDEVENYLLAVSPMTGGDAAEVRVTPVRVVCQNTLTLSGHLASEVYHVWHTPGAAERIASWLSDIYNHALEKAEVVKEAMKILAKHKVENSEQAQVLAKAYPNPKPPRTDAPDDVMQTRVENFKWALKQTKQRQEAVSRLFAGEGTGQDHPAAAGTAWGLYNAVTEYEDYRRGRGNASICQDALFGGRAQTKAVAFDACLEISRN